MLEVATIIIISMLSVMILQTAASSVFTVHLLKPIHFMLSPDLYHCHPLAHLPCVFPCSHIKMHTTL